MKAGRRIDVPDLVLGVLSLVGSAGYLYETAQIPASLLEDTVGARGVPLAFGWTMASLGVVLCLRALLRGRVDTASTSAANRDWTPTLRPHVQALGLLAILAAYVALVPFAGYIPSTALLIGAVAWFIVNALVTDPIPTIATFVLILAGLPIFLIFFRKVAQ